MQQASDAGHYIFGMGGTDAASGNGSLFPFSAKCLDRRVSNGCGNCRLLLETLGDLEHDGYLETRLHQTRRGRSAGGHPYQIPQERILTDLDLRNLNFFHDSFIDFGLIALASGAVNNS